MELSRHAETRCQQRSIPPLIREWLHLYGAEHRTHGATKRFFDRAARKRLAADVGAEVVSRMGDLLNHYVVESDTHVITAGVRTRRIKRQ
jgi:hypothetical protein